MAKPDLAIVLADMISKLESFLPTARQGIPDSTINILSLAERDAAIGNIVGKTRQAGFWLGDVKAGRFDVGIQCRVWESDISALVSLLRNINGAVANARASLLHEGFLKLETTETATASIDTLWTGTINFKALYEFTYEDRSDSSGLIVRVPIATNQERKTTPPLESNLLTNMLVVWNSAETLPLEMRGPRTIIGLSGLMYIGRLSALPAGSVSLICDSQSAVGAPTMHATLTDFIAAITASSDGTPRNERFIFPNFSDFTAEFAPEGDPIQLGDWDNDGVPDKYQPISLRFSTPILLPKGTDRLVVAVESAVFTPSAVLYLRADTVGVSKFTV